MAVYKDNKQVPDPTPVAIPIKYTRQSSYNEHIRQLVRSEELARVAMQAGAETFEEANDFDVGDDVDHMEFGPGHEEVHDPIDQEVINRLTTDEYARKVEARFQQLEPLVNPKGKSHGKGSDAAKPVGMGNGSKRVGQSNKKLQGKSGPKQSADDTGGVSETDVDVGDVEE